MRHRRRVVGAALGLLLAACGGKSTASGEGPAGLRTVRMGVVGAAMQMTFAPYTSVPESQDYWADEGLKLKIQHLPGSTEVLQAVAAGRIDTGVILSPPLYSAVAAGVPIQSFYNVITRNFAAPRVPVDSPIKTIADIGGRTVGVSSLGAGSVALIRAMVASEGGDPKSVKFVAVGAGADVAAVVRRGSIDVVGLWDAVFATLEGAGINLRRISNEYFDNLGFQGVVLASRKALEAKPDFFAGIGRAIAKGTVFTAASPRAAVKAHWTVFPSSRPAGVPEDRALKTALAALEARLGSSDPVDGKYGNATSAQIEEFGRALRSGGGLKSLPSADAVYTDALIEAINDFDAARVAEEARSYADQH
jgi:NitT/TauT family transport system substrate-binding protein